MILKYNENTERYNNFSCGESFQIQINSKWKAVRIEYGANGWYVIDEDGFSRSCKSLEGLKIRE